MMTIGYSANAAGTGGMLSISDGVHSASIALFGQFSAAGFHVGTTPELRDHGHLYAVRMRPRVSVDYPTKIVTRRVNL